MRLDSTVDALDETGADVDVTFRDGEHARYDLVIGADGVHSRVRHLTFPEIGEEEYVGQVCWRAVAPRPPEVTEYLMYHGAGSKVGLVAISAEQVYLYMLQNVPEPPERRGGDRRDELRAALAEYGGSVPQVAATLEPGAEVRRLTSLLVPAPWHRGRAVLIGDAAHATTPHISYGLGIAVEDGLVLTEELVAHGSTAAALNAFSDRRFERARMVVENSVQLSKWEQDPHADMAAYGALIGRTLGALTAPI
ncbi:FAD-dependent monooxygenase [Microbacterium elymi]|uniref:FAD-dependent monooxygenase n=1 Tax=Microbacterium elymi TaxID=2909587 RepID=A0ABY5NM65_9MICO|nr:FAD-dependent monooxygenase [Microbacterium elymi]UUT36146.1 FAD-dependent monooxygenase [Microbacterium elymi]